MQPFFVNNMPCLPRHLFRWGAAMCPLRVENPSDPLVDQLNSLNTRFFGILAMLIRQRKTGWDTAEIFDIFTAGHIIFCFMRI
jgi:hypothetical protein